MDEQLAIAQAELAVLNVRKTNTLSQTDQQIALLTAQRVESELKYNAQIVQKQLQIDSLQTI